MTKKIYKLKNNPQTNKPIINYQQELNSEQLDVVQNADGPCLVLAGAGSGKTRTLVYRVAYLLERGIRPENILLVTFTNKAAREMTSRVETLLKYKPQGLWSGTFHHIGNRILRKYISKLNYSNNYTILDESDSLDLIKNIIGEVNNEKDKYFPKPRIIKHIISFATNSGQNIELIFTAKFPQLDQILLEKIKTISNRYKNKKKNLNLLDYDDLLFLWLELLKKFPGVKKALSQKFQYILVDEYQDTNHLQASIIENLANHHGNILVVGDDAQSIYSFRAADISNILDFPKKFPQTKIFKLETNYRSTPEILELANNSIKNNLEQFGKNLKAVKDRGEKPIVAALNNSQEQAEFITQRILEIADEGTPLNKIAVLFRADYHALELELELNKKNIPYQKRGGLKFFEQAHLKDILAFLKILNNPHDEISWTRALLLQPGIGKVGSHKIIKEISGKTLTYITSGKIKFTGTLNNSWINFKELLTHLIKLSPNKPGNIIQTIKDNFYYNYAKANFENADKRLDDIDQLINFSDRYKSITELVHDLTLSESYQAENITKNHNKNDENLIISTIHQAKGLEWDVVFVIHLAQAQFPHVRSLNSKKEIEEERRLFYVACTRAKNELYLTFPITTYSHTNGLIFTQPSEFIQEIDSDLFEEWSIEKSSGDDLPTIEYLPEV